MSICRWDVHSIELDLLLLPDLISLVFLIRAAYCPHGPSHPPLGGAEDNNDEGEQWAPVYGRENHWVLLTPRDGNLATSCLSHIELNGEMPSWGLDDSNKDMKHHIMCCTPLQ